MVALTPEAVYAASPEFDLGAGSQPLDDGLGHYSYDGGASWEDQWGNKSYDQGASWSNQPPPPAMPGLDYGGTSGYFEPPPVADPWGPGLDYQEPDKWSAPTGEDGWRPLTEADYPAEDTYGLSLGNWNTGALRAPIYAEGPVLPGQEPDILGYSIPGLTQPGQTIGAFPEDQQWAGAPISEPYMAPGQPPGGYGIVPGGYDWNPETGQLEKLPEGWNAPTAGEWGLPEVLGASYRAGNTSILPESWLEKLPDPDYFPLRTAAGFATSPLGVLSFTGAPLVGLGGLTAAEMAAGTMMGAMAGRASGNIAEELGAPDWAVTTSELGGNLLGFGVGMKLPGAARAGARRAPRVIEGAAKAIDDAMPARLRETLASEQGSVTLPFGVRATEAETGVRPGGRLLTPRCAEQLVSNYTPADVVSGGNSVKRDLERQISSTQNVLHGEAEVAFNTLTRSGLRVVKAADGNLEFRGLAPSADEVAKGWT